MFFIDTSTGQIATHAQLRECGVVTTAEPDPPKPWLRVHGTPDATTLWYSVLRKEVKQGVHIGALCIRHSDRLASLLADGWQEVPLEEIGPVQPGPWPRDAA